MSRRWQVFACCAAAVLCAISNQSAFAEKPQFAKKATAFPAGCFEDWQPCKPLKIFSPDQKNYVQVSYEPDSQDTKLLFVSLTVFSGGRNLGQIGVAGSVDNEILWSPDSRALCVSGNNNGNSDYGFAVYQLNDSNVSVVAGASSAALQDMVRSFPPCRAKDPYDRCAELANGPHDYIGTAVIDWLPDSSGIVIMAEVTCSS